MAKETFNCPSCDGAGTISFKQNDTRFRLTLAYCPFCGADIEESTEEEKELDFEDE